MNSTICTYSGTLEHRASSRFSHKLFHVIPTNGVHLSLYINFMDA